MSETTTQPATFTARRTVFAAYGACNSAWQVRDGNGNAVRIRDRGREIGLIFKNHIAAMAALEVLNAGQPARLALSIGRRADAMCFAAAEAR